MEIDVKDRLEAETEWINDPLYSFVTIEMDEILFEGGRSIRFVADMLYISCIVHVSMHIVDCDIYNIHCTHVNAHIRL